jgi:hypothetical protein
MHSCSRALAVQYGDPLGKLVLLESLRSYMPHWKVCDRELWETVPVFLAMVILLHDNAWQHTAEQTQNSVQNSVWKCWTIPHIFWIWQSIDWISTWLFFNLQWRLHTSYHHMAATTGTNTICIQDGLTSHMLWQVPQTWRRICRKIMYQSHLHCIVLVSSSIYRYCKLSDPPSQLVLPTVGKMILVMISDYLQLLIITNTNLMKSHNHQCVSSVH